MLETKSPTPEQARAAETEAEKAWRGEWRSNTGNCRAKFKNEAAFLAARRQSFRSAAVTGTRQTRTAQ
jgi:hypothetical protein